MRNGVALIAHDGREKDLLEWWWFNRELLSRDVIYTNVPASVDRPEAAEIITIRSGADGGEMKTGALISDGAIGTLIYFWHPKVAHAHDVDVKALIRVAVHHNIALACNRNSADHIIASRVSNPEGYFPEMDKAQKHVALIAHDSEKEKLVEWCSRWSENLSRHALLGTGTTAGRIRAATGLPVEGTRSGPDGGDFQVGARIVEGGVDYMFFFWSTRDVQPHDVDVKALLRVAVQFNVGIACNQATADRIISSHLFESEYDYESRALAR
ncbi:MAG: methylglyoxal synthase [Candidatus Nitrospinota bacterium M3_3B_026]